MKSSFVSTLGQSTDSYILTLTSTLKPKQITLPEDVWGCMHRSFAYAPKNYGGQTLADCNVDSSLICSPYCIGAQYHTKLTATVQLCQLNSYLAIVRHAIYCNCTFRMFYNYHFLYFRHVFTAWHAWGGGKRTENRGGCWVTWREEWALLCPNVVTV
jgi:hypothetical protein